MPEFPGGEEAMMKFIIKDLRYPITGKLAGVEGRVFARFVVEIDGLISNVEIIRGINPAFDQEVVRVINTMPRWNPGRQGLIKMRVFYTLPFTFRLNGAFPLEEPTLPKQPKDPFPLTLIRLNNGQSISTPNAATNKELPLILVNNKPFQIEGLDWTKATDSEIFSALNLTYANTESAAVINGEAAKKWQGVRWNKGIVLIFTKK
jgi:TonB family protein